MNEYDKIKQLVHEIKQKDDEIIRLRHTISIFERALSNVCGMDYMYTNEFQIAEKQLQQEQSTEVNNDKNNNKS